MATHTHPAYVTTCLPLQLATSLYQHDHLNLSLPTWALNLIISVALWERLCVCGGGGCWWGGGAGCWQRCRYNRIIVTWIHRAPRDANKYVNRKDIDQTMHRKLSQNVDLVTDPRNACTNWFHSSEPPGEQHYENWKDKCGLNHLFCMQILVWSKAFADHSEGQSIRNFTKIESDPCDKEINRTQTRENEKITMSGRRETQQRMH